MALDGVSVGLLSLAAQRERLRPSDVATELQVTRPVVSRHLQALESSGAIRMVEDPDDGRAWFVEVMPEGFAMLQRFRDSIIELYADVLGDWEADDVERLTSLLVRLGESMATRRPAPRRVVRTRKARGGR